MTPSPGLFFVAPSLQNQDDFEAIRPCNTKAASIRVPFETLVDRGETRHRAVCPERPPVNYEASYNQILASLEFFEPERRPGDPRRLTPTPRSASTPRPSLWICRRARTLEVRFISNSNLWIWNEDQGEASHHRYCRRPYLLVLAGWAGDRVRREVSERQNRLWAIDRDGSNLQLLVSPTAALSLANPTTTEFTFSDNIEYMGWIGFAHAGFRK
jgi:hypothetical protein